VTTFDKPNPQNFVITLNGNEATTHWKEVQTLVLLDRYTEMGQ